MLFRSEVKENMKEYISQAGLVIDIKKAEINYNSTWFSKLPFSELYRLAGLLSVTQMLERNDFKNRLQSQGFNDGNFDELNEQVKLLNELYKN